MPVTTLTHSPAQILQNALVSLGLGTLAPTSGYASTSWPVYSSAEPDRPDAVITVKNTSGIQQGRSMIDGRLFQTYGIQIRVRHGDEPTGWTKADQIRGTLAQSLYQLPVTISSSNYLIHAIVGIGPVLPIGKELPSSKRSLFTVNALMSVRATN